MFSSEINPFQHPECDEFNKSSGFDQYEVIQIGNHFETKLIKGFYKLSSDKDEPNILTILPSLDVDPSKCIIDEDGFWLLASSRLKGMTAIVDLVACRYIDKERVGYGPKRAFIKDVVSDKEKNLSCTKTTLPLISNGERFELTKEVYSLNRPTSEVYPQREIMVSYSLSWPTATLPPKNS